MNPPASGAYVERYRGFLPVRLLLVGVLLAVLPWGRWERLTEPRRPDALAPSGMSGPDTVDRVLAALSVPAVALGVLLVLAAGVQAAWTLRRRTALAADEQGLYLGPSLLPPRRPARFSWQEIGRVDLRQSRGVSRSGGAAAVWNRVVVRGHGAGGSRLAVRLVDGWRYDPRRLAEIAARAAPGVRVER